MQGPIRGQLPQTVSCVCVQLIAAPLPLLLLLLRRLPLLMTSAAASLCRGVKHTAVDTDALPDCLERDMDLLTVGSNSTDTPDDDAPPSDGHSSSASSPGLALLAGLFATAAVVVTAVAGRMLLRLRKAGRRRLLRDAEAEELLRSGPLSALSSSGAAASAAVASAGGARARPSAGGLVCVSRRKRVAALLCNEVQRWRGGAVEMVPMEALPTALAHQLGSTLRRSHARLAGRGMAAVPEEGGPPGSEAALLERAPAAFASAILGGAGAATPLPASRQWQLPSESLRLQEQELEVKGGWCLSGAAIGAGIET